MDSTKVFVKSVYFVSRMSSTDTTAGQRQNIEISQGTHQVHILKTKNISKDYIHLPISHQEKEFFQEILGKKIRSKYQQTTQQSTCYFFPYHAFRIPATVSITTRVVIDTISEKSLTGVSLNSSRTVLLPCDTGNVICPR